MGYLLLSPLLLLLLTQCGNGGSSGDPFAGLFGLSPTAQVSSARSGNVPGFGDSGAPGAPGGSGPSPNRVQPPTPAEVPGPLGLAGAGVAFAFSRKLRRRIAANR